MGSLPKLWGKAGNAAVQKVFGFQYILFSATKWAHQGFIVGELGNNPPSGIQVLKKKYQFLFFLYILICDIRFT